MLIPAPFAGTVLDELAWCAVAEAAKARSTGFTLQQAYKNRLTCSYMSARDTAISKQSPLACRELLSVCRGVLANHCAALQMISWVLK